MFLFLFPIPGEGSLCPGPSLISSTLQVVTLGEDFPLLLCVHLSYFFYVIFLSLSCRKCSVTPQFFPRINCSVYRCRFGMKVGEGEFKLASYAAIFQNFLLFLIFSGTSTLFSIVGYTVLYSHQQCVSVPFPQKNTSYFLLFWLLSFYYSQLTGVR